LKYLFEISEFHKDSNSQSGSLLGSVGSFLHTIGNANVILRLHFWPAPFYVFALVASPRLGL